MANYWETYFISKYDSTNLDKGYNLTSGGNNGKPNAETRKRMSVSAQGNTSRKGTSTSIESRRRMSQSRLGKELSVEHKQNISKGNTGKPKPEGFGQAVSIAQTGRAKHSNEQKQKWSVMRKGKPAPNKGKTLSEETKRKKSFAMKGKTYKIIDGKRVWSSKT